MDLLFVLKLSFRAGDAAQTAECLPSMHKAIGSNPSTTPHNECSGEPFNSIVLEVEEGGSGIQSHPLLQSKFKTSLDYMIPSGAGEQR